MKTSLYNQYRIQIRSLASIVIILNIIFLFKIFTVQILDSDKHIQDLDKETIKILKKKGHRGKIVDRNNEVLADNMKKIDFWVNTNEIFDTLKIASIFSETFNKPKKHYLDLLAIKTPYQFIEKNVEEFYCENILLSITEITGLRHNKSEQRFYPHDNLASSIIGAFKSGQAVSGVEYLFNEILSGAEVNVKHQKLDNGEIKYNDTLIAPGEDIVLTIDLRLQSILENELKKGVWESQAISGNGVIVNPYTGEILAMASLSNSNLNKHIDSNLSFYRNTAISNSYEPGSTFKIVALAAVLEDSLITLKDSIDCENGKFILKNGHPLHDHEPRGKLSISDVFAYSSNIGMAKISDLLTDQQLYNKSKDFGFGSKTGIFLPNEQSGILRHFNEWSYQSSKSIAMGQEISCTSLQLAMAYSSIANGGYLLDPIIIKSIGNSNVLNDDRVIRKVLTYETATILRNLLRSVVSKGSGTNASISGYDVSGKTGTAQKSINGGYSNIEYISSFASIFPTDKPRYVCIISIDSPNKNRGKHWGNETAAPIVKNIYKKIINLKNIQSDTWADLEDININQDLISDDYIRLDIIPDFKGKTLKQAIEASNKIGIKVDPLGFSGLVVWQSIEPGSTINKKDICKLKIDN